MVEVLTPGPVAMDLLTQVQIHRLDDVVTLTGPAVGVATIWTAADAHAAHPGADDDRTLDQRRFDAVVTICAAALARPDAPAGRAGVRPTVYLFADLATWAGLAEHPVELDGYGVIPAGAAREHFTATRCGRWSPTPPVRSPRCRG